MLFKKINLIFAISLLLLPSASFAATLFLDPASGQYAPGDVFGVQLKVNLENGECINTVEASLKFPNDIARAEDFSTGDSIISIWIEKPSRGDMDNVNSEGALTFSGGIPGGYCGKIPGDPGDSNILGEIFFKIPDSAKGDGEKKKLEFLNNTRILLNDGLGTAAKLTLKGGEIEVSATTTTSLKEWDSLLKTDKIPPEPFMVEIDSDPGAFDGKYFALFTTNDKQTGVDHYEVSETKLSDLDRESSKTWIDKALKRSFLGKWRVASSPYLLSDQSLQSVIKVRAIDKAGNERIVDYVPKEEGRPITMAGKKEINYGLYALIIALLAVVFGITAIILRKRKNRL